MRAGHVGPLFLALAGGCGSAGSARGPGNGDEAAFLADERSYLTFRREDRSCESLRNLAETEFANQNHAGSLETNELVMAHCSLDQLAAIEKTMVILARPEALSSTPPGRSVRVRLALPLPPGDRLLWFGAYADRKLGLNNLSVGPHRVDVELHLWRAGSSERESQLIRATGGIDVRIDGRMPVWLDAALTPAAAGALPLALKLEPTTRHLPPGADARSTAEGLRRIASLREEMPPARTAASLDRAGLSANIELELCFDDKGQIRRVDPLGWPHPRHLGAYLDGLRDWRLPQPPHAWFCASWRQIMTPATRGRVPARE